MTYRNSAECRASVKHGRSAYIRATRSLHHLHARITASISQPALSRLPARPGLHECGVTDAINLRAVRSWSGKAANKIARSQRCLCARTGGTLSADGAITVESPAARKIEKCHINTLAVEREHTTVLSVLRTVYSNGAFACNGKRKQYL